MQIKGLKILSYVSVMLFAFIMLFSMPVNAQGIKRSPAKYDASGSINNKPAKSTAKQENITYTDSIPEGSKTVTNSLTGKGYSTQVDGTEGLGFGNSGSGSNPFETVEVGTGRTNTGGGTTNKALFSHLAKKASELFMGLREIIYVVSAFGILGVAIGGFFGNINWKWFGAIAIGLMVIAVTSSLIKYLIGEEAMTYVQITDSLK